MGELSVEDRRAAATNTPSGSYSGTTTKRVSSWTGSARSSAVQRNQGLDGYRGAADSMMSHGPGSGEFLSAGDGVEGIAIPPNRAANHQKRAQNNLSASGNDANFPNSKTPAHSPPRGKPSLSTSNTERQMEGQRAAAQRLRAWQEKRRCEDGGGKGGRTDVDVVDAGWGQRQQRAGGRYRDTAASARRAVRNYNIKDDGDEA